MKRQFQTFEIDKFLDFSFLDVFASSRKKRCLRAKFLISYSKTIRKKQSDNNSAWTVPLQTRNNRNVTVRS